MIDSARIRNQSSLNNHYHILGLLAILILFLQSCQPKNIPVQHLEAKHEQCIQNIIANDASLGKIRNHACENISLTETIINYVDGIGELDFTQCPMTFLHAFDRHIKAWQEMTEVTDEYDSLRGEMHVLFDQIKKGPHAETFEVRLKKIWDTWADIEKFTKK